MSLKRKMAVSACSGMYYQRQFNGNRSNGCESVVFHLPHLMPSDAVQRKRHIGNDLVHIIFSDCEYGASFSGISGQFGLVSIIVRPCKQGLVSVEVQVKDAAGLVRESSNRLMLQSLQRNHVRIRFLHVNCVDC